MPKKALGLTPAQLSRRLRAFLAKKPEFARAVRGTLQLEFSGREHDFWMIEANGRVRRGRSRLPEIVVRVAWSHFQELVARGRPTHWFAAYRNEQIRIEGDPEIERKLLQLLMELEDEEA